MIGDLVSGPVRLRPLVPDDLEQLLASRDGAGGVTLDPRPDAEQARRRTTRRIERSGRFHEGRLDLGIEVGGRLVGTVEARQPREGLPPGVYEIGIGLFETSDRRQGHGTEAVALLTRHLFSDPETFRVQASTDVVNTAMRRVLEKLGYTEEGVMRGFMPGPGGKRADYVLYGLTRAEWDAVSGSAAP